MTRVAVVGAGITGLTAAYTLSRRDVDVVILDAAPIAGGKLRTAAFSGRDVDLGADAFLLRNPAALELCRELGLEPQLVHPAERRAYLWSYGRLRPFPSDNLLGVPLDPDQLAASGCVSPQAVDRIRADLDHPQPHSETGDSVGRMVRSRLGDEITDRLVDPFLGGIYATTADGLSLSAAAPQLASAATAEGSLVAACRSLRAAGATDPAAPVFGALPGGMARLIAAVTDSLGDAFVPAAVTGIQPTRSGWALDTESGTVTADQVIVTTPATNAANILRQSAPKAADRLADIEYAGVVMVTLALPMAAVPRALDASGFVVPRRLGLALTACSWASSKWAHLAQPDTVILRASLGHVADPAPLTWSDSALLARVRAELAHTMGVVAAPTEVRIIRWPSSFPQYRPGHGDEIRRIEDLLRAEAPGVHVGGAAIRGIGIPACVANGRELAGRVAG